MARILKRWAWVLAVCAFAIVITLPLEYVVYLIFFVSRDLKEFVPALAGNGPILVAVAAFIFYAAIGLLVCKALDLIEPNLFGAGDDYHAVKNFSRSAFLAPTLLFGFIAVTFHIYATALRVSQGRMHDAFATGISAVFWLATTLALIVGLWHRPLLARLRRRRREA